MEVQVYQIHHIRFTYMIEGYSNELCISISQSSNLSVSLVCFCLLSPSFFTSHCVSSKLKGDNRHSLKSKKSLKYSQVPNRNKKVNSDSGKIHHPFRLITTPQSSHLPPSNPPPRHTHTHTHTSPKFQEHSLDYQLHKSNSDAYPQSEGH